MSNVRLRENSAPFGNMCSTFCLAMLKWMVLPTSPRRCPVRCFASCPKTMFNHAAQERGTSPNSVALNAMARKPRLTSPVAQVCNLRRCKFNPVSCPFS